MVVAIVQRFIGLTGQSIGVLLIGIIGIMAGAAGQSAGAIGIIMARESQRGSIGTIISFDDSFVQWAMSKWEKIIQAEQEIHAIRLQTWAFFYFTAHVNDDDVTLVHLIGVTMINFLFAWMRREKTFHQFYSIWYLEQQQMTMKAWITPEYEEEEEE